MQEIITIPRIITREYVQRHPDWIFVYGNDSHNHGALGQAWFAQGEPNTFPIYTCRKLCSSASNKYWSDNDEEHWKIVQDALDKIPQDKGPIIPFRKIGEGCSRMQDFAPRIFRFMREYLDRIQYPNIVIDYSL